MGVGLFKKYVSSSMIICYRSVARHPFLVCMVFLLIWMQRLFPLFFSFLVSSSPVIVSTAVLLGTLLSYGQPNIPEIEKERPKSEQHEIRKLESKVTSQTEVVGRDGNFASEETNGSRIEVVDRSFEVEKPVHDDNSCVEVNKPLYLVDDGETVTEENGENPQIGEEQFVEEPNYVTDEVKVVLGSRYSPLKQSEDDHIALESDDRLWEGSADPLNSDPALLWKRVEGDDDDDGEDDDDDDDDGSDSDLAESSSPDASMADIIPMLDELHPLLSEEHEIRQVHNDEDGIENHDDSEHSIESSESSSSSESDNDDGVKLHEDLVAGDEDEDRESKHSDKEDEQRSAITWTEDDQKNLMNLGTSEFERNRHLENLIAMRMAQKTHEDSESGDEEDKEDKHTDKEDEPKSAITWTEDDQKNLMNLGTSELERNRHLENLIAMRRAQKTHEDLESGDEEEHEDEEDKEDKHTDKEDEPKSAITWTEDDQKNLMNLGTSELERNRRLENLIARRRARNTMRMQAESNLIDLDTADFPWNSIPPISTARNNPFDYDSHDNIPGSAPSVLLKRRNPFDLPYDSSEEKPDLVGDTFQQEILGFQPKEPHFRRHESFNVGPSNFGGLRSERQETKLRPYFVPERVFQRQFSGISDSKASSVPDTESVSSADDDVDDDLEDRNHEDEHSLKLVSEKDQEHEELTSGSHERPYFVPEHVDSVTYERQLSEVSDSKLSSIHDDTDSVSSKDHNSLEPELGSEKDQENEELTSEIHERPYFVPEHVDSVAFERQSSEVSDSKESVSSVDDLVINDRIALSQEPELISFEDDDNVESVQVPEGEISVSNVTNQQEVVNDVSSLSSSSSSSNEESEQIYNEKEGDDVATSVSETSYNFEDHDSNQIERSEIGLSLEVSQPKEPVYDMSPRSITRNLSSSSICNGLKEDVSERVQSLPTSEATSSLQSQEIVPKMEMESRSITDNGLNEDGLNKDESFKHNDEQHESSSSVDVLDMNAYQQLQQVQEPESNEVKSLNSEPQIPEVVHEENLELLENQDPGNEISVNINSDVVEVVETEDNDDEIDEDLLVELDAVGDFSFSDLVSTLNDMEIEEDPHVLQTNEDSNSKDLGTTLNETDHNLETKPSGNKEDSCSKDLESTLDDEIKQNHDLETKISVDDEDSYSKDLESNLNEETEEGNNNILETFYSVDEHAFSKIVESTLNEIKYQPQMLDHVLETNSSGDQDLLNKPLKMDDQGQVMEKESDKKEVEAEPIKTNFINDTKNETENESSTSNTVKE